MSKINILPLRHWWQIAWHTPSSAVHSSEEDKSKTQAYATSTKETPAQSPPSCVTDRYNGEMCWRATARRMPAIPTPLIRQTVAWQPGEKQDNSEKQQGRREKERVCEHAPLIDLRLKIFTIHVCCFPEGNGRARRGCLHLNMTHMVTKNIK